jgi:single-stranded-DNA-specific exonuclease
MKKIWHLKNKAPQNFSEKFPEYIPLVSQLLYNRGITKKGQAGNFFNFDYGKNLHNPFLMKGMEKAVEKILKAVEKKEKIAIFGDYDTDGITSSAILAKTLKVLGNAPKVYIPDRAKEGYGMNLKAIRYLKKQKINLIITVDCGISNFKEIVLANQLGIEVIVTDHHCVPEKIPPALAILNPRLENCSYPFKDLAGVGVAFKLVQGLIQKKQHNAVSPPLIKEGEVASPRLQNENIKNNEDDIAPSRFQKETENIKNLNNGFEKWLLDLVALGTVADCVPLLGENRALVHYGLIVLNKTKNPGLKKLIEISRVSSRKKEGGIISEDISFVLAPRLNVAGRMDHANLSFRLLMSEDGTEIEKIAQKLEKKNQERQKITKEIVEEAKKRFYKKNSAKGGKKQDKIIFEADSEWPVGLVGLAAGRLSDELSRPALIFSKGDKKSVGSGRSIPCFNLIEAVSRCQDFLLEFGGHSQAAGFTLLNNQLSDFCQALKFIAERNLKEGNLKPTLEIESETEGKDLNWDFFNQISKFAPFGQNNPTPLLLMKNLQIKEMRAVGNGENHLKMKLLWKSLGGNHEKNFEAIGFNFGKCFLKLKENDFVDVVFELTSNLWNGYTSLQLKVVDLKRSKNLV